MLLKKSAGPYILLTLLFIALLALLLTAIQRYFHSSEINLLTEKAEEQNLEYELVIHNQLTNSYSFTITE
ncbi:hypothetical protein [Metabacillus sp. 84]|uniref:hypothetical protein n=1 Tax=Metabacillus sp. 84 TaxID=3404705 RepID=UPI003CF522A4